MRKKLGFLQKFLQLESSSGIILLIMAVIAMIWANSPLAYIHQRFIDTFLFIINEGLMAVFFLVVTLELKRGFLEEQLFQLSKMLLPMGAALGGMLIPAAIYIGVNYANPHTLKGWATPVATDIAFALGVLSLFGRRVPVRLKLFLLAITIFDDLGAIIIIAFFYSHGLAIVWIFRSVLAMLMLCLMNVLSIRMLTLYLFFGALLWFFLLKAGVHPTIAGVLLALVIPGAEEKVVSPAHRLETFIHPWVAYLIMPLFALANAGFSLQEFSLNVLTDEVVVGIIAALFIGKQLGVFSFSWLLIRTKMAKLPEKSGWLELYGVALLCGIGFTMSLFLGTLSFQNENIYLAEVRLGVIIGSIMSGLVGAGVLLIAFARKRNKPHRSSIVD